MSSQTGAAVLNAAWIGQDFGAGNETEVTSFSIRQYGNSAVRVTSVHVEHSDNGTNWTQLQNMAVANNANTNTYTLNNSANHRYWRLRAGTATSQGWGWVVNEVEFFSGTGGAGGGVGTLSIIGRDYAQYSDQVTVAADGSYSVNLPYSASGTNQVSLVLDTATDYVCSCPAGCTYSSVNAPLSGLDFYITDAREAWFQAIGGGIAALASQGTVLTNPIPAGCSGSCKPYLLTRSGAVAGSSGVMVTGGGSIDLSRETGEQTLQLDEDNARVIGRVSPKIAQENYAYFQRLYKFPANPTSDFTTTGTDAAKPTGTPVNAGVEAFYHNDDLTILDPWQIDAGESIVIFVAGDLNINNTILVAQTGFLAFIVQGDIIIDSSVGHVDPTAGTAGNSVVEGVYVANGKLLLPTRGTAAGGDYKFVGEGTFVGWGGVELDRDYADTGTRGTLNTSNPAEVFRYRPDFVVRAPSRLKVPRYTWREVAP